LFIINGRKLGRCIGLSTDIYFAHCSLLIIESCLQVWHASSCNNDAARHCNDDAADILLRNHNGSEVIDVGLAHCRLKLAHCSANVAIVFVDRFQPAYLVLAVVHERILCVFHVLFHSVEDILSLTVLVLNDKLSGLESSLPVNLQTQPCLCVQILLLQECILSRIRSVLRHIGCFLCLINSVVLGVNLVVDIVALVFEVL
jgi:hypothetical protein